MNCFCKDVISLAGGDQTARPEMTFGVSGSSLLLSLMRLASFQVSIGLLQPHHLKGETRDVFSLRIRGTKMAVPLGVVLPRSTGFDGLARVQLLQALRARLLTSSLQTFSQYLWGGSRTSCFCKGVAALAQGDHTARFKMASGLSQYSALVSLLQMVVVQVTFCLPWCNWVTVWTRCCPLPSLAVDVRLVAHFTVCQCTLSGVSVSSFYLLSLKLSARISSCEVLEPLVHCAQTQRNALVPASMLDSPLVLSTPRCVPQVMLDLPSYRAPCLRIRAARRILHLDARLPTVIDLRGFLRLPLQQAFCGRLLAPSACVPRRGSSKGSHQRPDCATLRLVQGGDTQSTSFVLCLTVWESQSLYCLSALDLPFRSWIAPDSRCTLSLCTCAAHRAVLFGSALMFYLHRPLRLAWYAFRWLQGNLVLWWFVGGGARRGGGACLGGGARLGAEPW